jgi:hypothetical protein
VILRRDVGAHHAQVSVGDLGLRENLFVYFNIVCSQSKIKSSLLLLLFFFPKNQLQESLLTVLD